MALYLYDYPQHVDESNAISENKDYDIATGNGLVFFQFLGITLHHRMGLQFNSPLAPFHGGM